MATTAFADQAGKGERMGWWFGGETAPLWGGWWVMPLVCMAICILMCVIFRARGTGRRFCCWGGGVHSRDLEEMKKEIRDLKEQIRLK